MSQFQPPPNQPWQPQQQPPYQQPYQPPQWQPGPSQQQPGPPKKKSRRTLWIILAVLAVLVFGCIGAASLASKGSGTVSTTPVATSVPTQAATKPTATPKPKGQLVTHGTPRIGGPMSDFYGKYGTPNNQGIGGSQTWIVNQQIVNASSDAHGNVSQVSISVANDVSVAQMIATCTPYLPVGASKFNAVNDLIDYHSSIGEVVMQVSTATCVLTIAQS